MRGSLIFIGLYWYLNFKCIQGKINPCYAKTYTFMDQVVQVSTLPYGVIIEACAMADASKKPEELDLKAVLKGITVLKVMYMKWLFPTDIQRVDELYFRDIILSGEFGACTHLKTLSILDGDFSEASLDWLSGCKQLRTIVAYRAKGLLNILNRAAQIDRIDIDYFSTDYLTRQPIFTKSSHPNLSTFTLDCETVKRITTNWTVFSSTLTSQLALLPNLSKLAIRCNGFDVCAKGRSPVTLPSLRKLQLRKTNTSRVCFREYLVMPRLEELIIGELSDRDIKFMIEFADLLSAPGQQLTILPRDAVISRFHFTRTDYMTLSNTSSKVILEAFPGDILHPADCSCEDFWLQRALRSGLIVAPEITCTNTDNECERVKCERVACEGDCVCCRDGQEDRFFADCRGLGLAALPPALLRLRNLTELLAPDNNITTLPDTLPDNISKLDLRGNKIRFLNGSSATALFKKKHPSWRLSGNPLGCTCDNKALLDLMEKRVQQIEDYRNVECTGKPGPFRTLAKNCRELELNKEILRKDNNAKYLTVSVGVATAIALAAVMMGLGLYYRRAIQIVLFARGWCLCWLRNEEHDDDDRPYDVFLSFCHEDSEVVLEQMLPTLEEHYSVCIHIRDWVPGDMIPANIRTSVKLSKRTLIVLSKNFAKSMWGIMEFQTAYASGLDERRIRVVMVILDDVLEMPNLNKEYQEYVRFNTYVKWGDPWFWSKLRYALPHKNVPRQSAETDVRCTGTVGEPALAIEPQQELAIDLPAEMSSERSDTELPEVPSEVPSLRLA